MFKFYKTTLQWAFIVFKKEWLDVSRDAKGLLPIIVMPLLFALTSYGALTFFASLQQDKPDQELSIIHPERAAPLVQALREAGIHTVAFAQDEAKAVAQIRSGTRNMVLNIPEDFEADFREQRSANIELIWDVSRSEQHALASRVKWVTNTWFRTLGAQRLILRGVSPEAAQVGQVVDVNTAKEQQMAMRLLGSVPLYLVLVAFMAGAGIATELAAGEREGRTLETLLLTPVPNAALFTGKWLMLTSLSTLVITLTLAGQFIAIKFAPVAELGLRVELGFGDFMAVLALLLPLLILASALLLFVSLQSRALKDSQTYTQLLTILPTATGIYLMLSGVSTTLGLAATPLLGTQALITDALSGNVIAPLAVILNTLASLAIAAGFAVLGMRGLKLR